MSQLFFLPKMYIIDRDRNFSLESMELAYIMEIESIKNDIQ